MRRKVALTAVFAVLCLGSLVAPTVAQSTATPQPIDEDAPYYNGTNGTTNMTEWVPNDGNATASGMLEMIARIPGIFIGSGDMDPSGSGYEGFLLTGLVVAAGGFFALVGTGAGPVASSMVGMVLAYGLTFVGLIPAWIQPLLVFTLVGIPAATAIIRVFRG